VLGFSRYQWLVIAAAWLGWGFDVFDALLFNLVAPNCIPTLLGLTPGTEAARAPSTLWTGILSSTLLIGWAFGGVLFGRIADRWGRQRTLLATIFIYSLGTALCALAQDVWQLLAFRMLASLGIGGEWAIGATLVAESVPEARRVEAGVILQTASPLGLALAGLVNYQVAGVWMADDPAHSWRHVFLFGLIPAALALLIRLYLRESEHFNRAATAVPTPPLRALWAAGMRGRTASGLAMAVAVLLAWWSCTAFLPLLMTALAQERGAAVFMELAAQRQMAELWKVAALNWFNLGGLLGVFLAIPLAKQFGRRQTFAVYFAISVAAILLTFGGDLAAEWRIRSYFAIGVGAYGVFAAFVFYLPELFPTRLRATGAGLTYNLGRLIVAAGPFVVGAVSHRAGGSAQSLMSALVWVAAIPFLALLATRWITETRGQPLDATSPLR